MNEKRWLVIGATDYGFNFTEVSNGARLKKWAWFAEKYDAFVGEYMTYYVRYPLTMSRKQALDLTIAYHEAKRTTVLRIEDR